MPPQNSLSDPDSVTRAISTLTEQLPPETEIPRSFLSLIHKSSDELAWNRLLCYFLDPTQPHGIGDELLLSFLEFLQEKFHYEIEEKPHSANTVVEYQPPIDAGRAPDLVLYEPSRWCLCIELKVHAAVDSSQLHHYAKATTIGTCDMKNIAHPFYLLIGKPKHRRSVRETRFNFLTWTCLNKHILRDYVRTLYRQPVPTRPAFQLIEFSETIREELTMGGSRLSAREEQLCRLYLNHHDPINKVSDAWKDFRKNWWDHFQDYCRSHDDNPFAEDEERWDAYSTYGHIFKPTWWLNDRGEHAADIGIAYRIHFTHDLDKVCEGDVAWEAKCNTKLADLRRTARFIDEDGDLSEKHTFHEGKEGFNIDEFPESYFEALLKCFLEFSEEFEEQIDSHMEEVRVEILSQ